MIQIKAAIIGDGIFQQCAIRYIRSPNASHSIPHDNRVYHPNTIIRMPSNSRTNAPDELDVTTRATWRVLAEVAIAR
jgi:hypothetical protein